jgi:hypothetical protein
VSRLSAALIIAGLAAATLFVLARHLRRRRRRRRGRDPAPEPSNRLVTLVGTARAPHHAAWPCNAHGSRTIDAAKALVQEHGVQIPVDVTVFPIIRKWFVRRDNWAEYGDLYRNFNSIGGYEAIRWDQFYNQLTRKIPVRIRKCLFRSDLGLIEVLAHEMYELNALREEFRRNDWVLYA